MYVRCLSVVLLVLAAGCTAQQLNEIDPPIPEPPCDENNPYRCPSGECCNSAQPTCWGPDATGYYCEPPWYNPDDPGHMYGARHRPQPRAE